MSKKIVTIFCGVVLLLSLTVCQNTTSKTGAKTNSQKKQSSPIKQERLNTPQLFSFEETTINMGQHTLELKVALSDEQHDQGLMYQDPLVGNEGMLFIYEEPELLSYWNKNVSFDIDVAYFDDRAELICVKMLKANQLTSVHSEREAKYVLEMKKGWFLKNEIGSGYVWKELLMLELDGLKADNDK